MVPSYCSKNGATGVSQYYQWVTDDVYVGILT
jgi:hypothetical protein